jgi:hypothetical protein
MTVTLLFCIADEAKSVRTNRQLYNKHAELIGMV